MANGFDKIINESFSKYLTKNGVSTSALNGVYGKKTSKKLNESKLNESWVIDTWEQTDEDPGDFAREYNLGIEKIDLGTEHWSETSYKFTGSRENIERAINDGYFYSGNDCSDDVADLVASNNLKEEALNEAVPRDLMGKIKNTRRYSRNKIADGFNTDSIDYQSADMQEITATDVMRMKKSGEDLSDIYVLNDDGDIIELDRYGHPIESGSTGYTRANQSLKKTLDNATKIYKGKIGLFSQTQPDKYAERTSDPERRRLNIRYGGHGRSDSGDVKYYAKSFHKELEGPGRRIKEIKKAYDDGDISRKEMEAKIAKIKAEAEDPLSSNSRLKWAARDYNSAAENKVNTRYYDSNQAARKNVDEYEKAKHNLKWAQYRLKDNEEKLSKAQAGEGSGNQRIIDLKRKIASLKRDLEYYEKELAENPAQKELDELQRYITKAAQDITNNQAVIDKLLRRNKNESLKRKSGKRLNIKNK